ncbi:MAG: clostripain-related cysteine peptidase [Proteobacteria bacterium]|nr:clostripain-related cysteine peptidase [Pseudomonadota bacterium]
MSGCAGCGGKGNTCEATLKDNIKVIVAADFDSSAKDSTGTNYPTGTTWYLINGGGANTIIGTVPEQNLDDPAVLTEAVTYAFKTYPADHYGIILWNHGGAWNGGFGGDTQDGTLPRTQIRGMTAVESRDAILQGLKALGGNFTRPTTLDFMAFDTCLLGAAEVSYLFKDIAQVYIANAEIDFGSGWNYKDTLTALAARPSMTPIVFATMELETWETLHQTVTPADILLRSHTSIDTSKINDFATTMKNLVTAIRETETSGILPNNGDVYARALSFAVPGYGKQGDDKDEDTLYRDLGQFLKYLVNNASGDVITKAQAAIDALAAMQIGRDYGTLRNPTTTYELGFNIALPPISTITDDVLSDYATKAAEWTGATGWKDFLYDLKYSTSNEVPVANYTVNAGTKTGTIIPTGSSLTFASMELVKDNFTTGYEYGITHFGTVTSGTTYNMIWDGKVWTLATQVGTTVITWFYNNNALDAVTSNTNNLLAASAIVTDNNNEQYDAYFLFQAGATVADSIALQSEDGKWDVSSIDDFAVEHFGATFQPALIKVSDGSFVAQGTAEDFPSSGGVAIGTTNAASGTYYLKATVENAWGNMITGGENDPITLL